MSKNLYKFKQTEKVTENLSENDKEEENNKTYSDIQNQNTNNIIELNNRILPIRESEEFQITDSQLIEMADMGQIENLPQKEDGNTPMDFDFNALDLDSLLRSHRKNQSPQYIRNSNYKNNILNISGKINREKRIFETAEKKNKEKFVYNLSKGPVEISEDDMRLILDNVMNSNIIQEESHILSDESRIENKTNLKDDSSGHISYISEEVRRDEESERHIINNNHLNNLNLQGINLNSQFNQTNLCSPPQNENPLQNIFHSFSIKNFEDFGRISIGMISYVMEKFKEVEELKSEVNNLKNQLQSRNNILDFRNKDKEIILYANNIKLVTPAESNPVINSNRNEIIKTNVKPIYPINKISQIENNFMDQINDDEFDKFLQSVKDSNIKTNNFNQFQKTEKFNSGFKMNNNQFNENLKIASSNIISKPENNKSIYKFSKNNLNMNDRIEKDEEIDMKNDKFDKILNKVNNKKINENEFGKDLTTENYLKNNTNILNKNIPQNINDNINDEELEMNNSKLKNIEDDEFDNLIKNIKNKKLSTEDIGNDYINVKNLNNINFKNPINNFKSKDLSIHTNKNKTFNNISSNQSYIQESTEIKDDEFDNFLNKNFISNKTIKQTFQPPMKLKENLTINKKIYEEGEDVIKSEFMSGNQNVVFKANSRVKNLMKEMEQSEDDFRILEEIEEEPIKKRDTNINIIQTNKNSKKTTNNLNLNKTDVMSTQMTSSKKFTMNQFSSEKLNTKRLFTDHIKSLDPESTKNINSEINNIIPNKKLKSNQPFKIMDTRNQFNITKSNKPIESKILAENLNKILPILPKHWYNLANINTCEFLCHCCQDQYINKCEVCDGNLIINKNNFSKLFSFFCKTNNDNTQLKLKSENKEFLAYQYKLTCWKFYILSKLFNDEKIFTIDNILKCVMNKFKRIYEMGMRSLLMKVAEKDSSINRNMNLLLIDIKKSQSEHGQIFILELSDGFKSVFSEIKENNPISNLIIKNILIPGMKINIGLARIEKINEDLSIYINIYYNSISKADSTSKLGVNTKSKFLIKNLANLREDGGEVSLIDVIVLKKYDYFCHDFSKNEKFSSDKLQKLNNSFNDNLCKEYSQDNNVFKNIENKKFPYENIIYSFKIICIDSLLYLDIVKDNKTEFCLKRTLKPKLIKKCIIEFKVKNKEIFQMIDQGNRYQIGLLNLNSKIFKDNLNKKNDPKCLNLKASDSVLIKEIKCVEKNNNFYQNILNELGAMTNIQTEEIEVTENLISKHYNGNKITHEEVSSVGAYISHSILKQENGHNLLYLFLVNKNNNLILIKIHEENFYDFSKVFNSKNGMNSVLYFKNLSFQIVYYFDKKLTTFKGERIYESNFDNKNIVIYLESTPYSTFKTINSTHKFYDEIYKMIKIKTNKISGKFYDEDLLNQITNLI